MAKSEETNHSRILLIGGDGGLSGVPRHIRQIVTSLEGDVQIKVLHDKDTGGFAYLSTMSATSMEVSGLASSLRIGRIVGALRALRKVLQTETTDLVWAHARVPVTLLRVLLILYPRLARHTSIALTFHGLPFGDGRGALTNRLVRALERGLLRFAPPMHLVFLSSSAAKSYGDAMGVHARRHQAHILPNSSDLGRLPAIDRKTDASRVLVMTGRDARQKNLDAAARVFTHLPQNYRLHLCGAGTDLASFRQRFIGLIGAEAVDRIKFLGPQSDIRPHLARADGYLLTSVYEGFSIGALEAFEAGLPLAMTSVSGTDEILSVHPLGRVIKTDDPARAAIQVKEMVEIYVQDRDVLAADIRLAWQENYSFVKWREKLAAMMEKLLRAPQPTGQDSDHSRSS